MTSSTKPLTFSALDGLAFAAARGTLERSHAPYIFVPTTLGALFEFLHLLEGERLPAFAERWVAPNGAGALIAAYREDRECWTSSDARRLGFVRASRTGPDGYHRLTAFLIHAQRAARDIALLPGSSPAQLAAAMEEMENNIHEHSRAPQTGVLAYRATRGVFEFVVADHGVGLLASLRSCPENSGIRDEGMALEAALTDGTSRFGRNSQRGTGFRPIFLGLMNLRGSLRFRSGDHALIIDGSSPTLAMSEISQKPMMDGFFASVRCESTL
jgi:hypothetical protein